MGKKVYIQYCRPFKNEDDEQIKALRAHGLSIREIAHQVGLSTSAVQRGLK